MKRSAVVLLCVGALLVALMAGVALSKDINCRKSTCLGTKKGDLITGSDRSQTIKAGSGNDKVFALGGNDKVYGQGDDDDISGGTGDDTIYGAGGDDELSDDAGPFEGNPADRDVIFVGPETISVDVGDGDVLDVVCIAEGSGGTSASITYDSREGVGSDKIPSPFDDNPEEC